MRHVHDCHAVMRLGRERGSLTGVLPRAGPIPTAGASTPTISVMTRLDGLVDRRLRSVRPAGPAPPGLPHQRLVRELALRHGQLGIFTAPGGVRTESDSTKTCDPLAR